MAITSTFLILVILTLGAGFCLGKIQDHVAQTYGKSQSLLVGLAGGLAVGLFLFDGSNLWLFLIQFLAFAIGLFAFGRRTPKNPE